MTVTLSHWHFTMICLACLCGVSTILADTLDDFGDGRWIAGAWKSLGVVASCIACWAIWGPALAAVLAWL